MRIGILYSSSRRKNTSKCIQEINECIKEGKSKSLILIVPEQFSAIYEDKITEESIEKGLFTTQVLSFSRLSHNIFNQTMTNRDKYIDNAGKSILVYEIINSLDNLTVFKKAGSFPGFSKEISSLIKEFKRYGVTSENLKDLSKKADSRLLADKLFEIYQIYDLYNLKIAEYGFCDQDDDLYHLARIIRESNLLDDTDIWFDGFDGFTPQEMAVIRSMGIKAKSMTFSLCTDNLHIDDKSHVFYQVAKTAEEIKKVFTKVTETKVGMENGIVDDLEYLKNNLFSYGSEKYGKESCISLYRAFSIYEEVRKCAAQISWMVRNCNMRYMDFCVVASSYEEYKSYIEILFRKYDIPYFMDERRPVTRHPLITYILSVLNVYINKFSYDSVFSCLKSPYSNMEEKDVFILENYVLQWGIKGVKMWEGEWTYKKNDSVEEEELLKKVNCLRHEFYESLRPFFDRIRHSQSADEFIHALYDYLINNGIYEKLSEFIASSEDETYKHELKQSWNMLMMVFDQLHTVVKSKKPVSKFKDMLSVALSEYTIGVIPPSKDSVAAGSIDRTRNIETKVLFILGANEPFPGGIITSEGILNDNDRAFIEKNQIKLADDTRTQTLNSQLQIYNSLSIPSERIFISYSMTSKDGKAKTPSFFISRIKSLFPDVKEESGKDYPKDYYCLTPVTGLEDLFSEKAQLARWYKENMNRIHSSVTLEKKANLLEEDGAGILYGDTIYTSVSRLERYVQCPFSYFVEYGLKAEEREVFGLKSTHTGTILHDMVKMLTENLKITDNMEYEKCYTACIRLFEDLYKQNHIFQRNKRLEHMGMRLVQRAAYSFYTSLLHLKSGSFRPFKYEAAFGPGQEMSPVVINLENNKKILISGRIDRADISETENEKYIRIIDYKSSVNPLKLYRVYEGLDLQLPVYLHAAAKSFNAKPAGMYYFELDKPFIKTTSQIPNEDVEAQRLKMLKLNGYTVDNPEVLKITDGLPGDLKTIQPSKLVPENNMKDMFMHVETVIRNICDDIFKGKNDIKPVFDKQPACTYCNYKSICAFDDNRGCEYKFINQKDDKEIIWRND